MEESRNLGIKSSVDVFTNGAFEVLIFEDKNSNGLSKECIKTADTLEKEFSAVGNIKFVKENYRFDERNQEGFRFEVFNSLHKDKELQNNVIDAFDKAKINYSDTPLYHLKKQLDENDLELAKDKAVVDFGDYKIIPIERKENMYGVVFEKDLEKKGTFEECKVELFKGLNAFENHRQNALNADDSESGGIKYRAEDRVAIVNGQVCKESENLRNTNYRDLYYEMHILDAEITKAALGTERSDEMYEKQHERLKKMQLLGDFAYAVDNKEVDRFKIIANNWDLNKEHLTKHINTHQNLDEGEKRQFIEIIESKKETVKVGSPDVDKKLIEITQDNEKDYPYDSKKVYPVVDKMSDVFVIEYSKEKELYGVVLNVTDQLTAVGGKEACLEEMPKLQNSWNKFQEEENEKENRFVDPVDLQKVDLSQLEWKKEKAELMGISLEQFNKNMDFEKYGSTVPENIPFVKETNGEYVLKSVDQEDASRILNLSNNNNKLFYREYTDTMGEDYEILTKEGIAFAKENKIHPSNLGRIDYSEKEAFYRNILNSSEIKEKPINQLTEVMEAKNEVYAGSVKKFSKEGDPTEKVYHIDIKKDVISAERGGEFGEVKVAIRPVEREYIGADGKQVKEKDYEAIVNPKDYTNVEATISIKKEKFLHIDEQDRKDGTKVVPITVSNRNPESAKKDDLSVYENKVRPGMDEKEFKKALEDKNYIGTGWTQKPELLLLKQSQINKDELKKSIDDNNPVRTVAIIQRGGGKLITKDVLEEVGKSKEKHGEKFNEGIEKYINAVANKKQKENKLSM